MNIEDLFPKDPFEPTVEYVGLSRTPFAVPWAKGRVQIGTGFNTQRKKEDSLFLQRHPFQETIDIPLQYRECQSTSFNDKSGTDIATSSADTTFSISASVGGSFLGASGRGSYEESVRANKNKSSISIRAEHTCGQIDMMSLPRLDDDAVRLLRTSPDPIEEFRKMYGDFYVAGYRIGASNSTTISGGLVNKSSFEAKRAKIKVKTAFIASNYNINDVSKSNSDIGALSISAFDSLEAFYSNFTALTVQDCARVNKVAIENKKRAMNIAKRASNVLCSDLALETGDIVYQEAVNKLCDRGLVTELLLAPFALIREYQSILCRRFYEN